MTGALTGPFVLPAPRRLQRLRVRVAEAAADAPLQGLSKCFAFGVVFFAGWYLTLPETDLVRVPWWAAKHNVSNILIHEALFGLFLFVGGIRVVMKRALPADYLTRPVAVCLVALAVVTGVSSLLAPYAFHDLGRCLRLVLMAMLVLAVTHWAARDPLFVLRTFLLGLVGGSIADLVLTFQNPVILAAGVLPRLLGQNAPGPPMGVAVGLSGWLILLSRNRRDTVFALFVAMVCGIGAMISYSKTGMLAAFMGLAGVAIVSGRVAPSRRGRIVVSVLLGVSVGALLYLRGEAGERIWGAFSLMFGEKVASARSESVSVNERWSYVLGVSEIVARHPFGVGYSGFREAMIDTDAFRSGRAADEISIPADESNPHSMFLYYFSAGGIIGGLLGVAAFAFLCFAIIRGLGLYGFSGAILGAFSSIAYIVLAISVPYLFTMGVMLVPSAIAAGIHAHVTRWAGARRWSMAPPAAS